jgi:ferric-dicitrate binding protein FerR (iron transport regulator)
MKILGAAVLTSLVLLPARWQPGMTATNDPKTETGGRRQRQLAGARQLSHRLPVWQT